MIREDELLGRFERTRRLRDGEWMALCPAHADVNPSLHLTHREECWLLFCHAGCAIDDVLAAVGLEKRDLFADSSNGHRDEEAVYCYLDEQGKPLFEVVRFPGKQFRQRLPDGSWGLNGARRVLYSLPSVLEAVNSGEPVYVVEGEKDANALHRLGVAATCNPGGAGKWRREYSESLRGADVTIVADGDEPGRAHAAQVAEALQGVAATVDIVQAATGKDAADHLAAGKTIDQFISVHSSAEGKAAALRNPDPSTARPVRWAWRNRVAIGKLNLLVGNEGTGKGVVNAWQAAQLSHGRLDGDLKGQPVNVLIVGDEDALEDTWTPRLYAIEADWKRVFFPPADIGDLDVTTDEGIATLAGWVRDHEIGVVVFDALLDNLGSCDAYEPRQVRAALRPLRRFANDAGVAVLGSLHPRKGDALSFRDLVAGSHQFNAVSRSSLLIAEHPDDKRRRVLLRGKGNLSGLPEPLEFEIKSCAFQLNGAQFDQPIATDWEDADIDLEEVLPRRSRESKQESAAHWLRAYLGRSDWQHSAEVKEAGARAGFSERTLSRALEEMVDDGDAETRNTDTVPRRTLWRLAPPLGSQSRQVLTPDLARLDETAFQSGKQPPGAPVAPNPIPLGATEQPCGCIPPPSRLPGETICRYCGGAA